ncbi:trehalase family glycosidase [Rhodothermus bifroesti]|uniref:Alpha,alpha-trehalase n=2 Tax=Rhodothermus TaxID=29548 RepID=A0A7V2B283_RHOMR|nr:Periplasmic trehalase [bacterium HR18]
MRRKLFWFFWLLMGWTPALRAQDQAACRVTLPAAERIAAVEAYIHKSWDSLTRSHRDLLQAVQDPKLEHAPGTPWVLYIAATEDSLAVWNQLQQALPDTGLRQITLRVLPKDPIAQLDVIRPHGLLYLPEPYVVPGGRFNEMYGWDSYFIVIGLLHSGRVDLAKAMTDNHLYQVRHYGKVLNANRTYYLTRSQPPFLSAMVLAVYEHTRDRDWLAAAVPLVERYYAYWTQPPHLAGETGLSRYYDLGEGPAPEVVSGERDVQGRTHYDRVREYFRTHEVTAYEVSLYYVAETDSLTPLFYKGDRSMRESGFDPSNRYGPFSVDIIHYAPVDLNALLYRMEQDVARMHALLGDSAAARQWHNRAEVRRARVDRYLWDPEKGLYFDYNFRTGRRSDYVFATTFYPLWVGMASPEQAARVAANLYLLEAPGGLLTSTHISGSQWDAPYGWAPLYLIAVEGLRRYGYHEAADRLTAKFVSMVTEDFERTGVLLEKYDVVQRRSDVALRFGYTSNEIGFGWTNAVFLALLAQMD